MICLLVQDVLMMGVINRVITEQVEWLGLSRSTQEYTIKQYIRQVHCVVMYLDAFVRGVNVFRNAIELNTSFSHLFLQILDLFSLSSRIGFIFMHSPNKLLNTF